MWLHDQGQRCARIMALVIPNKLILLATPRTGSRALEACFKEGRKTKEHHVHPEDIPDVECPKYTICRNPYQQALSWYWHVELRHGTEPSVTGLLKFLKDQNISWYFSTRLNPYHGKVKDLRILRYDQDALATARVISQETGAKIVAEAPPRIGQRRGLDDSLLSNREVLKAIEARFPEDIELYAQVCNG